MYKMLFNLRKITTNRHRVGSKYEHNRHFANKRNKEQGILLENQQGHLSSSLKAIKRCKQRIIEFHKKKSDVV